MLKRVKLWCVTRPNGKVVEFPCYVSRFYFPACAFPTMKLAKEAMFFSKATPYENFIDYWRRAKAEGYTCRRLEVEVPDGK